MACICLIPVSCCAPLANVITKKTEEWVVWIYLIFIAFLWQVGAQLMFNSSLVMIANSVHPAKLGTLNGISQALGSLARAISPVTVSPLLAWSFEEERKFPTNFYFSFFVNAVICIILLVVSIFIPYEINLPYLARMEANAKSGSDNDDGEVKGRIDINSGDISISDSEKSEREAKEGGRRKRGTKGNAKTSAIKIVEEDDEEEEEEEEEV